MFDPVKNARVAGAILFILGILEMRLTLNPILLLTPVSLLCAGIGLYNKKLWGIYVLGAVAVIRAFLIIVAIGYGSQLGASAGVSLIIYVALFIWFYASRRKFLK